MDASTGKLTELLCLDIFELYDFLEAHKHDSIVRLEDPRNVPLTRNLKLTYASTKQAANHHAALNAVIKVAIDIGRLQGLVNAIESHLLRIQMPYELFPVENQRRGITSKVTHERFQQITGWPEKRSNPEKRDAALLVWNWKPRKLEKR